MQIPFARYGLKELGLFGGLLIGRNFSKKALSKIDDIKIKPFIYEFKDIDRSGIYSFAELQDNIYLNTI